MNDANTGTVHLSVIRAERVAQIVERLRRTEGFRDSGDEPRRRAARHIEFERWRIETGRRAGDR